MAMSEVLSEISEDYKFVYFTASHDKITKTKNYQQVLIWSLSPTFIYFSL